MPESLQPEQPQQPQQPQQPVPHQAAETPAASAPKLRAWLDFIPASDGGEGVLAAFAEPVAVLQTRLLQEVRAVIDAAQAQALAGRWVVGYVRYEAALAFDSAARVSAPRLGDDEPLLAWFAAFDAPLPALPPGMAPERAPTLQWPQGAGRAVFDQQLQAIHEAIRAGRVYQVNLTETMHTPWPQGTHDSGVIEPEPAEVQGLFEAMRRAQPRAYAAWIDAGEEQVLSVSPELFFHWDGREILCRPMKGTAARSPDPEEDRRLAEHLCDSEKERAENLMIVDLIRNDLSRIALPHSVRVPRLFQTTAWPTVWQMTSDVRASTRPGLRLSEVFEALFPCGSVTGAPKWEAMRLIAELEGQPRGVYCGAVGVIRPGGEATFNVPIRTLTLSQAFERPSEAGAASPGASGHSTSRTSASWRLSCGIGSGITLDAQADSEWAEWASKRGFLERASAPFELLETLAWRDSAWVNLPQHLARMQAAAAHFQFEWREVDALQALHQALQIAQQRRPQSPGGREFLAPAERGAAISTESWRVRLTCDAWGRMAARCEPLGTTPAVVRVRLAERPMQGVHRDFLRFKTTRRAHYDAFAPTEPGVFDTLLWNAQGELTEFTRGNVAIELDGQWCTPPLRCGLLAGVGRELALSSGRVRERVVARDELARATGLAFINSLRGWIAAEWN